MALEVEMKTALNRDEGGCNFCGLGEDFEVDGGGKIIWHERAIAMVRVSSGQGGMTFRFCFKHLAQFKKDVVAGVETILQERGTG